MQLRDHVLSGGTRAGILLVVLASTQLRVTPAAAGPGGPAAAQGAPVVLVLPESVEESEAQALLRAVRAHTFDLDAPLQVERPPELPADFLDRIRMAIALAETTGARGVMWVELRSADDVLLYLMEPDGLRVLVRRIPRVEGSAAATHESLAVIVRSVGDALVAGRRVGMTPVKVQLEEAPPAKPDAETPSEEPPASRRDHRRLRASVGYVGSSLGDQLPWLHGLGVQIDVRPLPLLDVAVRYDGMFPGTVNASAVRLDLQRNVIGVGLGVVGAPRPRVRVEAGGFASLDMTVRGTEDRNAVGAGRRVLLLPLLGAHARLALNPVADLWAFVDAGVDGVLSNVDYVVDAPGGRTTILEAHPVRARVSVGVAYAAF